MFKYLRSNAKVFYWVIAATFVLFLILGGLTNRGCTAPGIRRLDTSVVGSVNGEKISTQHYDQVYRQILAQMRQRNQGHEMNANQIAGAHRRAWDEVVNSLLVQQAVKEYGIKVTDQEVLDIFNNNPPPELLAQYRRDDGTIDMDQYYADLHNPEIDWDRAEAYVRAQLPWQKLQEIIVADAVVTDEQVREEYIRQSGRAVAEYVGVLFADLADDYTPSDEEMNAYYQDHQADYERPAKATCQVVRFAKEPSAADYEDMRSLAEEIREEIVSGKLDFAEAAKEYSDDGSASSGGDLGTFDRNRMVAPFTEVAFSLPVGEVSQPVKTRFGYHLIEVLDREVDAGSDEPSKVHARHILFKVTTGQETLAELYERAKAFRERVNATTFASVAEADSLELLKPEAFAEGRDILGLPYSLQGSNWLFAANPGEISPVFENNSCYYVVLAGEKLPAGPATLDEVRNQVELDLKKQHNQDVARDMLSPAIGEIQMGRSLAEVAADRGLHHAVTDTFSVNDNIPDVGYGTDFNSDVINGEVGKLIPEIVTQRGLYAAMPLWIKPFDEAEFNTRAASIRQALLTSAQNEVMTDWFEKRREAAEIVDLRHKLEQNAAS